MILRHALVLLISAVVAQAALPPIFENYDGLEYSVDGRESPWSIGVRMAGLKFHSRSLSTHTGVSLQVNQALGNIFLGLETGARYAFPARISPYVGLTGMLGISPAWEHNAENDHRDNNNDGFVDESGEISEKSDHMVAIYPELGFRTAVGTNKEFFASVEYRMTSYGRDWDRVYFRVGVMLDFGME